MKLSELKKERSVLSVMGEKPEKTIGDFSCDNNRLTSLEGSPVNVGYDFDCHNNLLTSLKGGPKKVAGDYYCQINKLISLEGAPTEIGSGFFCFSNMLTSLVSGPSRVGGTFVCDKNKLISLEGAPIEIGNDFSCYGNKLTSLKDIHKQIKVLDGTADFRNNNIKSNVLGLLKIKNLKKIYIENKKVESIINKYLPEGNIFDCQEELIEAGYEEYAQL